MTTNWIKCSDRMPPYGGEIICKATKFVGITDLYVTSGLILHKYYERRALDITEWTPYTEEAWSALKNEQIC